MTPPMNRTDLHGKHGQGSRTMNQGLFSIGCWYVSWFVPIPSKVIGFVLVFRLDQGHTDGPRWNLCSWWQSNLWPKIMERPGFVALLHFEQGEVVWFELSHSDKEFWSDHQGGHCFGFLPLLRWTHPELSPGVLDDYLRKSKTWDAVTSRMLFWPQRVPEGALPWTTNEPMAVISRTTIPDTCRMNFLCRCRCRFNVSCWTDGSRTIMSSFTTGQWNIFPLEHNPSMKVRKRQDMSSLFPYVPPK